MKEVEMYAPLKKFLESEGYEVISEVKGIDVMAKKDGIVNLIEMKTQFNMKLVYQLIERLKISEHVYAYIPIGKGGKWAKSYKQMCGLLKRLEVGLITLDTRNGKELVTVEFDPKAFAGRKNYRKRKSAIKEFEKRGLDLNSGGTKGKLMTAYKMDAIRIGLAMEGEEELSTKVIRQMTGIENAQAVLYNNYYKWFDRVGRGKYTLTDQYFSFKEKHLDVFEKIKEKN